jgi:predicted nucleic acid-binding Zn ribbon protein
MAPERFERDGGPRSLDNSLHAVAQRLGIPDPRGIGHLFADWSAIVGPAMAEHVQPIRIDANSLVVSVDHPAWATQVRRLGDDLLNRVADGTGLIRPEHLEVRIRR